MFCCVNVCLEFSVKRYQGWLQPFGGSQKDTSVGASPLPLVYFSMSKTGILFIVQIAPFQKRYKEKHRKIRVLQKQPYTWSILVKKGHMCINKTRHKKNLNADMSAIASRLLFRSILSMHMWTEKDMNEWKEWSPTANSANLMLCKQFSN